MLTFRAILLTSLGLLSGFAAAAQAPASTAGPTPTTLLSWVVWWAAGVVLLMAIITSVSVTSAAQRLFEAQPAEPDVPAAAALAVAPSQVASVEPAPAPIEVATPEEAYA